MKDLIDYYTDRSRLSEHDFLARHATPVLLHRLPTEEVADASFATMGMSILDMPPERPREVVHLTQALTQLGLSSTLAPEDGRMVVFAIAKRPGGIFQDRVAVGRTRNTDICLPFPKISKLH